MNNKATSEEVPFEKLKAKIGEYLDNPNTAHFIEFKTMVKNRIGYNELFIDNNIIIGFEINYVKGVEYIKYNITNY